MSRGATSGHVAAARENASLCVDQLLCSVRSQLLLSVPPGRPLEDQVRLRIALFNPAAGWCHTGLETYIRTHSPIPHPGYFCHFQGASGFLPLPGTPPLPASLSATLPRGRSTQGLPRDEGVDGMTGTVQCRHETSLSFRACQPRCPGHAPLASLLHPPGPHPLCPISELLLCSAGWQFLCSTASF